MRNISILLLLILFCNAGYNQQLSGIVKDEAGTAIANVTVKLHKAQDSALVKINATNNQGKYEFVAINEGNYYLHISHVGFGEQFSKPIEVKEGSNGQVDFVLQNIKASLSEVVVNSKKPMVEVLADKTVLNVE